MPDPDGVRALARRAFLLGGQVDVLAGQVDAARQVDWVSTRAEEFKGDIELAAAAGDPGLAQAIGDFDGFFGTYTTSTSQDRVLSRGPLP